MRKIVLRQVIISVIFAAVVATISALVKQSLMEQPLDILADVSGSIIIIIGLPLTLFALQRVNTVPQFHLLTNSLDTKLQTKNK